MDLSKLRKRSDADSPQAAAPVDYRHPDVPPEEATPWFDVFFLIGVGLLFLLLGKGYGQHLFGTSAYDLNPATNVTWQPGSPKAGQPVAPEELEEPHKTMYAMRLKAPLMDGVLFAFGAAMALAGLLTMAGKLPVVPMSVRLSAVALATLAVAVAVLFNVWACFALLGSGILPMLSLVVVLVGGMSLFMLVGNVRYMLDSAGRAPIAPSRSARDLASMPGRTARVESPGDRVHRQFTNQTLRRLANTEPARVVGLLQGPGMSRFLAETWTTACAESAVTSQDAPAIGLEAEMTQVGPYSAAVVTMPSPNGDGQAHFVGLVLRSIQRADGAVVERTPLLLYFTLERGVSADSASLCEWQAGDRVRYADSLTPSLGVFRDAMWQKVQRRQSAEDEGRPL